MLEKRDYEEIARLMNQVIETRVEPQLKSLQTSMDEEIKPQLKSLQMSMDEEIKPQLRELRGLQLIVENRIEPQIKLLAEGHQTILDTLAPKSRVDAMEEELRFLRSMVGILAEKVKGLEKAV